MGPIRAWARPAAGPLPPQPPLRGLQQGLHRAVLRVVPLPPAAPPVAIHKKEC